MLDAILKNPTTEIKKCLYSAGKTELYALDEFKVRKEVDFFRWYQDGRFDALPDLQYDELKEKIVAAFAEELK